MPGGRFGVSAVLYFNDFFRREANEGVLREFSWAFRGFEEVTVFAFMTKRQKCLQGFCRVPEFLKF
jgi:hypothetical protein